MQIALVAIVLLAGMWFTVLRPKPDAGPAPAAPAASQPTAPAAAGLSRAVDKAKAAAATSDAANARVQAATGGSATATRSTGATKAATSTPAGVSTTTKAAATASTTTASGRKTAGAAARSATPVDPSAALLAYLAKGKIVVLLFHGAGADDRAARKAVHAVALADKGVVSAYAPIAKVASYEAITSGVDVSTAPTILVIGKNRKATVLTGFIVPKVVSQAVGDARRADRAAASAKK